MLPVQWYKKLMVLRQQRWRRLGFKILVVSTGKSYYVPLFNWPQITDTNSPQVYWPMIESSLGIVGACLPILRALFTYKPASGGQKRRQSSGENLVVNETANNWRHDIHASFSVMETLVECSKKWSLSKVALRSSDAALRNQELASLHLDRLRLLYIILVVIVHQSF